MRRVLRASAIMGASSLGVLICTMAKNKVLAVWLGPDGVGLAGGLTAILSSAALLGGLGMQGSIVRQVARAREDGDARALEQLWWQGPLAAGLGALLTQLALTVGAAQVARHWLGGAARDELVGWLAPATVLSALASVYLGWMNGFRRTARLARANVVAAAASAAVSIAGVLVYRDARGALINVASYPAAQLVVAWVGARADAPPLAPPDAPRAHTLRPLLILGLSTMAAGLVGTFTQLQVRGILVNRLDLAAAGQFQAAWNVSMLYLGFVLSAMSTDYYPHLSEAVRDRPRFWSIVEEQTYAALLLALPVIAGMGLMAPLVLRILYSGEFSDAVDILRWQLAGDIIKVPAWALGYALLAQGRSVLFVVSEALWYSLYLAIIHFGLARFGLAVTGVAFVASYVIQLTVVALIVGYRPGRRVLSLTPIIAGVLAVFVPIWNTPALVAKAVAFLLVCGLALVRLRRGLRQG